jgi:hypothetical protein
MKPSCGSSRKPRTGLRARAYLIRAQLATQLRPIIVPSIAMDPHRLSTGLLVSPVSYPSLNQYNEAILVMKRRNCDPNRFLIPITVSKLLT